MKHTDESGRSMVEMLGVLAIIGVLSIGGIAGYTMAMNKFKANEITNTIIQGAIYCRTRNKTGDIKSKVDADTELFETLNCDSNLEGTVSFSYTSEDAVSTEIRKMVCKGLGSTDAACSSYTPQS